MGALLYPSQPLPLRCWCFCPWPSCSSGRIFSVQSTLIRSAMWLPGLLTGPGPHPEGVGPGAGTAEGQCGKRSREGQDGRPLVHADLLSMGPASPQHVLTSVLFPKIRLDWIVLVLTLCGLDATPRNTNAACSKVDSLPEEWDLFFLLISLSQFLFHSNFHSIHSPKQTKTTLQFRRFLHSQMVRLGQMPGPRAEE